MTDNAQRGANAPKHDQLKDRPALLMIDMINCFDFPGAEVLKPKALRAAQAIRFLAQQMRRCRYPIIYVNDNFGEWHSERSRLVKRAIQTGNPVVELLAPDKDDFFVIKPQFSGFYSTNLPVLLPKLGVSRLILTGIATDICVLFTAADAHMRDYELWIPEDCVAAEKDDRGRFALETMRETMAARTDASNRLSVADWLNQLASDRPT